MAKTKNTSTVQDKEPDHVPEDFEAPEGHKQPKRSSKEKQPNLREGARVRITEGEFEGVYGAIVGVTYKDTEQRAVVQLGDPADVRFAEVEEYHVVTRGQRQHVRVSPDEVELARVAEVNRGSLK